MKDTLLWLKYKPQNFDDLILLPRIEAMIKNGVDNHLILHGEFGIGKSALADLLTKDKATLRKNTSKDTSIEVLRNDIERHVNTMSDIFDPSDDFKYVYLDEFEKASSAFQDALKAYIDDNSHLVRFIFVTNHLHKIDNGIKTRCSLLGFDPIGDKEKMWWKTSCKNRIIEIAEKENIEISELDVKKIVHHNYPSMRNMIIVLSEVAKTGIIDYDINVFKNELKIDLYKSIVNDNIVNIQKFVMDNYGPENIQELFNLCGRPLLELLITKRKDLLSTPVFGEIYSLVAEHSMWLNTIKGGDPIVVATSLLCEIKKMLNGKN